MANLNQQAPITDAEIFKRAREALDKAEAGEDFIMLFVVDADGTRLLSNVAQSKLPEAAEVVKNFMEYAKHRLAN